jgi:hypothetical protein
LLLTFRTLPNLNRHIENIETPSKHHSASVCFGCTTE